MDNSTNSQDKDRVIGNVRLNYDITNWLSFFVRTGGDIFTDNREYKRAHGLLDYPDGYYANSNRTRYEYNTDFLLSFNKKINDDFALSLSAGGNMMRQVYKYVGGTASQLELPGLYNLSNAKSGVPVTTSNYLEEKRINSLYASGQVAFRNYLFVDFTARNDWSSTLPKENNSYFYPSVTVSAVLSDMLQIDSPVLSMLKVRGGWAQVGSDTNPYSLRQTFGFRDTPWNGVLLPFESSTLNNPTLRPEITTSLEFGVDVRLFNGRMTVDMTYYDALSEDLIVPVTVSAASGYTQAIQNVGSMSNKGLELSIGGRAIEKTDFSWDVMLNFARNINKVETLGVEDLKSLDLGGQWNVSVQARPGETYGSLFGPKFSRVEEGEYAGQIIYDANGLPVIDSEYAVLGNYTPDWTGGISNTFTYKGISLNVLVDAKMGGDIYSMTTTWGRYAGVLEETLQGRESGIVGEGVVLQGDGTYVPNTTSVTAKAFNQRSYSNSVAESSVFDASYVKLRQVQLGYTLPNKLMGRTPFRDVSVSFVGRNLAILYSTIPHIDPETAFNNGNAQGIEFGQLPSAASYGFNIGFKL
ncbi:outer membrane receptor protein involved in Fe transport [Flammeovirga yaeyamensis]|nr:TonB-dependent receptor [Flammeovirga yaeyamensis]MBB3701058.1 outer membrane receptor protein involved in Fe transport [Flammeovirga yaeyamensis]